MKFMLIILSFVSFAHAENIDSVLRQRIDFFQINALDPLPPQENRAQIELGRRLFMETNLSGNRNISCLSCHQPRSGTSDALALSRTEDNKGILRRNSQGLFNAGRPGHTFMFWDGRVHFNEKTHTFTTPEKNLPAEITNVLTSALSAQALFPMVSMEEMKGRPGDNEIADAKTNLQAWERILARLKNEDSTNRRVRPYKELFRAAYPEITLEKINIGHVAEAIGRFEREQFQTTGSPFNQYLRGDNQALTEKQKRGFLVFVDRGKCIACHQGGELGLNSFFASVGVPQWGARPMKRDLGRGEVNNETFRSFFFKTPSLLNVGLTAPYMHNGAFANLRDVINHYSNIKTSLANYVIADSTHQSMPVEVELLNDSSTLADVFNSIQAPFLRNGLNFTEEEKDDLESFLRDALTDPAWKP